ncbi:hypothetical protein FJZ48_02250 [Candidatus Uhrbacteria bacterium]|nr:hypothetical protein [Candidatus Uhrbacteria bacterium]
MRIPRVAAYFFATIPWILVIACLGGLFLLRFPPSGRVQFTFPLDGSHAWFDPFLPGQRVSQAGVQADGWSGQRIFDEPVYASARLPGVYDQVTVSLEATTTRQSLIELGILRDPYAFSFEMHPLWSSELAQGWRQVSVNGISGFVRTDTPDHVLVTNDLDRVVTWGATTTSPRWMDQIQSSKTYELSLRGTHDFYVVPTNGIVSFTLAVQDVNRSRGGDFVAFRFSHEEETLWTDAIGTGGSLDRKPNDVYEKQMRFDGLAPGVYRLSVIADDNVFIRRVTTSAQHWVVGPRLYLGDTAGYAPLQPTQTSMWTNSRHVIAETFHAEGRQTISLGSAHMQITKTHTPVALDRAADEQSEARVLQAPKGDVRFVGDAFFAFDPQALFLPKPRRMTDASNLDQEGVVAVITPYRPPTKTSDGGWLRLSTTYLLPLSGDPLKFVLSAPGIFSRSGAVDIRTVDLIYERPALSPREWWKAVKKELALAWRRL